MSLAAAGRGVAFQQATVVWNDTGSWAATADGKAAASSNSSCDSDRHHYCY